jgi:hypothetical protein
MSECWKNFMSFPCFKQSMYCPHCKKLQWRLTKTVQEYSRLGCIKCRLGIYSRLEEMKPIIHKKETTKVSGRYY